MLIDSAAILDHLDHLAGPTRIDPGRRRRTPSRADAAGGSARRQRKAGRRAVRAAFSAPRGLAQTVAGCLRQAGARRLSMARRAICRAVVRRGRDDTGRCHGRGILVVRPRQTAAVLCRPRLRQAGGAGGAAAGYAGVSGDIAGAGDAGEASWDRSFVIASRRSRACAPDDRLREAIHVTAQCEEWIASSPSLFATTWKQDYFLIAGFCLARRARCAASRWPSGAIVTLSLRCKFRKCITIVLDPVRLLTRLSASHICDLRRVPRQAAAIDRGLGKCMGRSN